MLQQITATRKPRFVFVPRIRRGVDAYGMPYMARKCPSCRQERLTYIYPGQDEETLKLLSRRGYECILCAADRRAMAA